MYGKSKNLFSFDSVQQWYGKNACAMSPKATNFESENKFVFELIELYVFVKDICGYFPCAPFPRLETAKVVWVLSFDLSRIQINIAFRYSYVISVFRHFIDKIK